MKEQTDYFSTLLELLQEVSRGEQSDASSLMRTALDHVLTMLGAQAGAVFLWNERTDKLHVVAQRNAPEEVLRALHPGVSLQQIPYTGRAIQERRVVLEQIESYPPDSLMGGFLEKMGYETMVAIPLFSYRHLFGAISVGFTQKRSLTEVEHQALSLLGQQLGIALDNLYLLSQISRSEQRYRELIEGLDFILWEYDPQKEQFTYISPQAERMTGYSREQLRLPKFWQQILHPNDRTTISELFNGAIREVKNCEMEYRTITKDGRTLWFHDMMFVDREEERVKVRGAKVEITERKRAAEHLQQMQEQMNQQERLRALGQMASGIAHDFNNALMRIMGGLELVDMAGKLNQKQSKYLEMVRTSIMDASNAVARMREFYRPSPVKREHETVRLNPLIEEIITLTRPIWHDLALARGTTIAVQTALEEVPPVLGQASEIREVLTNLIFNAIDAMPAGGILTIQSTQDQNEVLLKVSDTGVGMTDEVKLHCFDPFFTTKQENGSGLGLSVVYGIIRRMGGTIQVDSLLGQGALFTLVLPTHKGETSFAPTHKGETSFAPTPKLNILVAEDEEHIREALAQMLTQSGHTVYTAANGATALSLAKEKSVDLVLTDQGMPGMPGTQLALELKRHDPRIRVVLLTGWGDTFQQDEQTIACIDHILSKPLRREVLLNIIAQVYRHSNLGPRDSGG
jgi:PAS domain S-box-containing protein